MLLVLCFFFVYLVHVTLCDPMNHNPPGSSVHGILQARMLEWVAMPSSRGSPDPGIKPSSLSLLHWHHLRNPFV